MPKKKTEPLQVSCFIGEGFNTHRKGSGFR